MLEIAILWLGIQAAVADTTATCSPDYSSKGTHFMVGVPDSYTNPNNVDIVLTADSDANVRVTAPFLNYDKQYVFSKHLKVTLSVTIAHILNDTEFKGIEVESDKPISVVVLTGTADHFEGYLALPVTPISTEFVAASYDPYNYASRYFSFLFIVGVYSDTYIDIDYPAKYKNVHSRIELQPFETYMFRGLADVTGAVIRSTKPISVITGSTCSKIPVNYGGCQKLVEQMVPTSYWGLDYMLPPIYPRTQYLVRIFAREDNTEIAIYNGTSHEKKFVDALQYTEYIAEGKPSFIFADKPINVVQYGYHGDPFMMNGQGRSQQSSRYEFFTQNYYAGYDTLAVLVKTADLSGLRLDGKKDAITAAAKMTLVTPVDNYTSVSLHVSSGDFHVVDQERNQPFGAVTYALYGVGTSSGYPLQLTLKDSDCKANITGTSGQNNGAVTPVQCFHCEDMTSLKYCDKVTTCAEPDEVCYVQKYEKSQGVFRYRSGCLKQRMCNISLPGDCLSCCKGEFCNSYGCGDDGLQGVQNRGPLCFDCRHHGEHEVCETVQLCSSGEMCKVERYKWGDIDMHYVKGCADSRMCGSGRRSAPGSGEEGVVPRRQEGVVPRSLPVCSRCCSEDFCNTNCTSLPDIIG